MLIQQFFTPKIAHSSYLLAGAQSCAVVDPQRDVDIYLDAARDLGVTITHILHTHLHADFISGHMDLAHITGAKIYAPRAGNCVFDHVPLAEGDTIALEDMELHVLETPGHTPEHIAYVVADLARGEDPIGVFVGDTLFVGDVGRPDLFPDIAEELAGQLYHSLHNKLLKLPDFCEVYPAHGAGSLCGRAIGAKRLTTIGYERRYNPALQIADKGVFIHSLTSDMPPTPDHFSRCSDDNRRGPARLTELPAPEPLAPAQFAARMAQPNVVVVDARPYAGFAGMHVPGAWSLDLNGNFPIFAGWVLPTDKDLLLVADSEADVQQATVWARRVGLDRVVGYLAGGMSAWVTAGYATGTAPLVSANEAHARLADGPGLVLVDVRAPGEFAAGHIEGAINIPAPDLRTRYTELNPAKPTVVLCSAGPRGSMAASILKQRGFVKVYNVAGGTTGYHAAG
jgi:glyoxylase-like metal-dependent hydrolase (beta-lactamase superfamily II)/rhodanese-related sulfurtransferase